MPDTHDITVWTMDVLPDRVAAMQAIIADLTAATGVRAELVAVPAHLFNQTMSSAAASGNLPDVIGASSLDHVHALAARRLIDTDANAAVIRSLGETTWSRRSLELTREGRKQLAVPGSAWQQVLYYRKDLFAEAGLKAPGTYADILAAAKRLHSPQRAGFVAANKAGQAFTQQSFEHIAQGNGCEMVSAGGRITFASPQCVGALRFYRDILRNYSLTGPQDLVTVRAAYLAGKAAMALWPTMMLDELAGLRADAKPNCPECTADPAFLARNTGVTGAILGGSEAAQSGEMASWIITSDSDTGPARRFVEYLMGAGYADWLSMAPEERLPVRAGTAGKPTEYAEAWKNMPIGTGIVRKEPLGKFYGDDVVSVLMQGAQDHLKHWGSLEGGGDVAGAAVYEPIANAVAEVTTGTADPKAAAAKAAAALRSLQGELK